MSVGDFSAPADVAAHYGRRLQMETDCADVHAAMLSGDPGFLLVDTRAADAYAHRHIPSAISIPSADLTAARLADFGATARFVTYCWGPHCNGASKAAARIAQLGYPAKEMLGGIWGWEMEGYAFD